MTNALIDPPDRGCSPVVVSDVAHKLAREIATAGIIGAAVGFIGNSLIRG